ncbi:MAG TPA: lytic transglycosylase domain-containing protein [Solirubrobacteraceae bacterium]|nr:lytic transglycosylase domain-containing protein [Solirubrobacteraceae bacterium]
MSSPTATLSHRGAGGRRSVQRRRRWAAVVVLTVAVLIGVILAMPLARKAVNSLSLPLSYAHIIRQQGAAKHVDPALIAAVIYAETKFDPRPSSAGAEGLMQILPQTAEFLAHRSGATTFTTADLATPHVNIAYGTYYLRYLLDEYGGNVFIALAAYNGGEANVNRWLSEAKADQHRFTVGDIPFPETQAYVRKVLSAQRDYRSTYASQLGYG